MVQNAFYCGSLGIIKHNHLKRLLDVVDDVGKEVPRPRNISPEALRSRFRSLGNSSRQRASTNG